MVMNRVNNTFEPVIVVSFVYTHQEERFYLSRMNENHRLTHGCNFLDP